MAMIMQYREIPLDDLVIGRAQVGTQEPGKYIDSLVESIRKQGLLQPIVVCEDTEPGKWEILAGQRRFLAHRLLGKDTIAAAVLDERVDEGQAKAISITENLIRRQLSGKEKIDGVTYLYKIYGSAKAVAEATGLPYQEVCKYVKYPRLVPELKEMVDSGEIDVKVALEAQDASIGEDGEPDVEVAVILAKEFEIMSGAQRRKIRRDRQLNPEKPVDESIEDAKSGAQVIQIIATVSRDVHTAVQEFAKEEGTNQDEAAATLIQDALAERGFLEA